MAKPRRPYRDTDGEPPEDDFARWTQCPDCNSRDSQIRTRHQFDLVRIGGLDLVREHLTEQFVKLRDYGKERPDAVDSVCNWLANLMELYGNMVDHETGAPLPWYEARRRMGQPLATHEEAPDA